MSLLGWLRAALWIHFMHGIQAQISHKKQLKCSAILAVQAGPPAAVCLAYMGYPNCAPDLAFVLAAIIGHCWSRVSTLHSQLNAYFTPFGCMWQSFFGVAWGERGGGASSYVLPCTTYVQGELLECVHITDPALYQ